MFDEEMISLKVFQNGCHGSHRELKLLWIFMFFCLSVNPIRHIHMNKMLRSTSAIMKENIDVNFPILTKIFYQFFFSKS